MQFTCVHCGGMVQVSAAQLGRRGYCPHCRHEIVLPEAEAPAQKSAPQESWFAALLPGQRMISMGLSFVFHTILFTLLCLPWFGSGGPGIGEGEGDEVQLGNLPSAELTSNLDEKFEAEAAPSRAASANAAESLEVEPPATANATDSLDAVASTLTPSGAATGGEFDLGSVTIGGGGGGSGGGDGDWNGLITHMQRNGLDIVIAFDSTGSMGGEINQVKDQIKRIGATLLRIVPKARISLCTYRDKGDDFVVKGLPLTGNLDEVIEWLRDIRASGGGDHPEAVRDGLRWSVENNSFRANARKVILVFGDAPPHSEDRQACLAIASDFAQQQKGIVSTVTCRNSKKMVEFVEIAQAGGGESFLATDERQIMSQLVVLVFGSRHRQKVNEAFKMLDK